MSTDPVTDLAPLSDVKRTLLERFLQRGRAAVSAESPAIPRRPNEAYAPLSHAQEQVWLHAQMAGNVPIYNEPIFIHRKGVLDVRILERCFEQMVRRHEIWRTTFDIVDGQPVQIVGEPPTGFPVPEFDLRERPPTRRNAESRRIAAEDAGRPFDLKNGPLLRALVVRLGDRESLICMVFHQLVFDGVTAYSVVVPELATLYEAFSNEQPSPLPEMTIQYADFAHWQRHTQSPVTREKDAAYWKTQLGGELPLLEWPNDRPRPPVQSHRGAVDHFELQKELNSRLKSFSRDQGVSLYATLLAGFVSVLHRYTEQTDIIVGALWAGRKWPDVEAVAGDFVNPVALRIDLGGNPTFKELVARVRDVVVDAVTHDEMPLQEIVKLVQPKPDPSRNPLFQMILSLQPEMPHSYPGWDLRTEEVGNGGAKADLMLVVDSRPDSIFGPVIYKPDLFDAATISRLLAHWQTLLAGALAHPDCRISDLPLLTDLERHQILEWNDTQRAYPSECLHESFEAQVERSPDAVAVIDGNRRYSYRELNERSNSLAHRLRGMGVGPDVLVGIFSERSFDTVVGLLAILKAGGAYVPLDPGTPAERLEFLLRDSGTQIILTQHSLRGRLSAYTGELLVLDRQDKSAAPLGNLSNVTTPENLAHVIYTSGSTGNPKGVLGLHRATLNRMHWMWETFPLEADEICCQKTSLSFVDSVWEIFGPLFRGIPSVIVPEEIVKDPHRFLDLIHNKRITRIVLVPSLLGALLENPERLRESAAGIRYWITSGEYLSADLVDNFRKALPKAALINLYGCTEAAGDSTFYDTRGFASLSSVPIGRPIANTEILLLDSKLQQVPVGVTGKLYVGGQGLSRGYLNKPELTADRFLANSMSASRRGGPIYKTGDLARYLPDGNIEYVGRADQQVKIRGFRIELGEVEQALAVCPGVRQVAVVAREDMGGEKRLVAYVAPSLKPSPKSADLLNILKTKIPGYMIPSVIVFLDALPLLPNGKIDRRALPAPKPSQGDDGSFKMPQTDTERQLAKIWSSVLGVEKVARDGNFFDLGGHSISAVRLFALIEKHFSVKLPLASLLQAPTLAELAEFINTQGSSADWSCMVRIQPNGSRPPFFCAHGGGGNVLIYRDLAHRLGSDQPFYGLQSRGLDGRSQYLTTIEEMAALYITEIQKIQPRGPYYLGGYCMGGTVALEIGRQLYRRGEKVALLALFDTVNWSNRAPDSVGQKLYREIERLTFHGRNFLLLNSREKVTFFREKFRILRNRSKVWQGILLGKVFNNQQETRSQSAILAQVWQTNHKASSRYVARPYPGVITAFRPMKQYSALLRPEMKWDDLALGGLELITLPVYPAGMLVEPFVKDLATALRQAIDKTQNDDSPGN